jgi:hypothetical protein
MHEWLVRRAAPQHSEWLLKGGSGPFMSIDTKGGNRTFAAFAKAGRGLHESGHRMVSRMLV